MNSKQTLKELGWERRIAVGSPVPDATDELRRHFRENSPVLLDGAPPKADDRVNFIKIARESLLRENTHSAFMPAAILRETLDAVAGKPTPSTKAGLTAIGPKSARVWWDANLIDDLDDIMADAAKPRPVLRFYDVTGLEPDSENWNNVFDIDISPNDRGRTVDFWASDRVYVVDLGFVHADGRFLKLARTNTAELPREGRGHRPQGETARTNLRPGRGGGIAIVPDEAARQWAEAGRDYECRDLDVELVIHMAYRAFLANGPKALRNLRLPSRRDDDVLRREFRQRERARRKKSRTPEAPRTRGVLAVRLDAEMSAPPSPLFHLPVLVESSAARRRDAELPPPMFCRETLAFSMNADKAVLPPRYAWLARPAGSSTDLAARGRKADAGDFALARAIPEDADITVSRLAAPVFFAAEELRNQLRAVSSAVSDESDEMPPQNHIKASGKPLFGGAEARRFAKAGVRVTKMAIMLEGRMKPGARLKVAGKLVHADANGCFKLECVLSGRRAAIPMRAGTSLGGEARSLINVEWVKRGSHAEVEVH